MVFWRTSCLIEYTYTVTNSRKIVSQALAQIDKSRYVQAFFSVLCSSLEQINIMLTTLSIQHRLLHDTIAGLTL